MKNIALMSLGLLVTFNTFAQSTSGILEAWKGFSDPEIMSSGFNSRFSDLPKEARLKEGPKLWSGDFWAHQKGGINLRWNSPGLEGFNLRSPSKEFAQQMTVEQLATLAPSEKYDLYMGRYDYPLKREISNIVSSGAADWEGICNGWAPASMNHNEPTPKLLTNPDGIKIPFGSSDIKALVSYFYATYHEVETTNQMGLRCGFGGWLGGSKACDQDLNAGAFHIVLANKIGVMGESFVIDRDRKKEVWNQPMVGYSTRVLETKRASRGAARSAVSEVRVATSIFYVEEHETSKWNMVIGTEDQKITKMDLQYVIELDYEGKIVGGEWESKERPDFLWQMVPATNFGTVFAGLPALLDD
ncbi:MAG TPA: hypothetical protein VNJ01_15235 [Bacteriovoracaceae bacterium]|nr:hypothetical protein [Bacteriovoracaceae bacterium]